MGTKLQYAINPLATSSNNSSFLVNQVSDCGYSLEIGPRKHLERGTANHHFNHSVDEMFDSQNIESIKKTMLMQEDIFKQQVRELHRLYQRQMKLMYELKIEMTKNQSALNVKGRKKTEFSIWHHEPIQDIKSDLPVYGLRDDPRELSASCSGESPRMPKGGVRIVEERPSTSVRGTDQDQKGLSCSGLRRNNDGPDDEIDVELKLSIGCSSSKKRSNSEVNHCRMDLGSSDSNYNGGDHSSSSSSLMKREKAEGKGDAGHAVSSSSATLDQNIARSNWIFQDLSLNRT